MTLFPEVQKRAQEEIDSIVGRDRLPTYNDRIHLPYCEALMLEVLRWFPVVPIGGCLHCNE
jgi:cytochrome P450